MITDRIGLHSVLLPLLIIHMKKLLDSDWLRAVQFVILDYDFQNDNEKFCRPIIPCKAMTKILYRNSEKSFLECEKKASRNIFRHFFRANFFMFVLLISNQTVFLVQFEINLHESGECNFSFLKNSLVQINSKLNSKPYDYL